MAKNSDTKKPRKSRSKYTTQQKAANKRIRSGLATLKRKKVIAKETEVRKAVSTDATRKLLRKHKEIVEGKATTYKVTDEQAKKLKEQGYKIVGKKGEKRAVAQSSQYIRGGEVYERATPSRRGYKIKSIELNVSDLEAIIRKAFKGRKAGDELGFEVGGVDGKGGQSVSIYQSPESMLADLMAYQERGFKITHLRVYQTTRAQHIQLRRSLVMGSAERRSAKRREAYRRRKSQAPGKRAARGH